MAYQDILVERRGHIVIITFNRPERLNSFSWAFVRELHEAFVELEPDDEVRAVVLTGAGRAFSAGADLLSPSPMTVPTEKEPRYLNYLPHLITTCFKPTIAAVNGPAVGGGLSLALACDIRIASEYATFSAVWAKRGTTPAFAVTYLLPRSTWLAKALELMYTGDPIDAREALRLGLVHKVVPHERLMEEALSLAERIAKGPPLAMGYTKRLAYRALGLGMAEQAEEEDITERICKRSEDFQEGLRSFREKREPIFRGR